MLSKTLISSADRRNCRFCGPQQSRVVDCAASLGDLYRKQRKVCRNNAMLNLCEVEAEHKGRGHNTRRLRRSHSQYNCILPPTIIKSNRNNKSL